MQTNQQPRRRALSQDVCAALTAAGFDLREVSYALATTLDGQQLLRLPEVEKLTGIKRTHIYRLQQLKRFPQRIKLGPRASAYVASEVHAWIEQRISESRGQVMQ